jgi:hypothetical protein
VNTETTTETRPFKLTSVTVDVGPDTTLRRHKGIAEALEEFTAFTVSAG